MCSFCFVQRSVALAAGSCGSDECPACGKPCLKRLNDQQASSIRTAFYGSAECCPQTSVPRSMVQRMQDVLSIVDGAPRMSSESRPSTSSGGAQEVELGESEESRSSGSNPVAADAPAAATGTETGADEDDLDWDDEDELGLGSDSESELEGEGADDGDDGAHSAESHAMRGMLLVARLLGGAPEELLGGGRSGAGGASRSMPGAAGAPGGATGSSAPSSTEVLSLMRAGHAMAAASGAGAPAGASTGAASAGVPSGEGATEEQMPAVMEYLERLAEQERARVQRADRASVRALRRIRVLDPETDVPRMIDVSVSRPQLLGKEGGGEAGPVVVQSCSGVPAGFGPGVGEGGGDGEGEEGGEEGGGEGGEEGGGEGGEEGGGEAAAAATGGGGGTGTGGAADPPALELPLVAADPWALDVDAGGKGPLATDGGTIAGCAVLCGRGKVSFAVKARAAQAAGAGALVVVQTAEVWPYTMNDSATQGAGVRIPLVMVSKRDGATLLRAVEEARSPADAGGTSGEAAEEGAGTGAGDASSAGLPPTRLHCRLEPRVVATEDPILCEPFERGHLLLQMPCLHCFRAHALVRWLQGSNACPLCRRELPRVEGGASSRRRARAGAAERRAEEEARLERARSAMFA